MKKKIIFILFLMVFIAGCDLQATYDIELSKKEYEVEKKTFDVCQVISKIEDTKVRDHNRKEGRITEGKYSVECPSLKIKHLGKQEVTIEVNGHKAKVNFYLQDTTAPTITTKKETFQVEEGNEYFDIKQFIEVKDNYDPNPEIGYTGTVDINTPGEYTIEVSAIDEEKNTSRKTVKVIVKEKEIEIVQKEVIVTVPGTSGSGNSSSGNANGSSGGGASIPSSGKTLPAKDFLFANGYDMKTGFSACQSYRDSAGASGRCSAIVNNDTGIPYGYRYTPY